MINHTDQYNRIENTFREIQKEYEIFRKNPTYRNRLLIQNKIKEHRQSLTNFTTSINNIFMK